MVTEKLKNAFAMFVAFGETYTWTGKYSEIWDLTEKNWTNSIGE